MTASRVNGPLTCGSSGRVAVCAESDGAEVPVMTATARALCFSCGLTSSLRKAWCANKTPSAYCAEYLIHERFQTGTKSDFQVDRSVLEETRSGNVASIPEMVLEKLPSATSRPGKQNNFAHTHSGTP